MQFEVCFLNDLDDESEDFDAQFIEAPSWLMALQKAEAMALAKKKYLAQLVRLE